MTEIIVSAPGKVILFGEHSVVHGRAAVAAAASDLRVVVTLVSIIFRVRVRVMIMVKAWSPVDLVFLCCWSSPLVLPGISGHVKLHRLLYYCFEYA